MRVSKEKAAENRQRILNAASRLIRERGISGAGVDALTEAAGMTHGGLYSQFGSKEKLIEEAFDEAVAASSLRMDGVSSLTGYIANYLSGSHRDMPERGCAMAALCGEIARESRGVRQRFTGALRGMVKQVGSQMSPALKQRQRDEEALAVVVSLIGALMLARAVNDPKLSDEILKVMKNKLAGRSF